MLISLFYCHFYWLFCTICPVFFLFLYTFRPYYFILYSCNIVHCIQNIVFPLLFFHFHFCILFPENFHFIVLQTLYRAVYACFIIKNTVKTASLSDIGQFLLFWLYDSYLLDFFFFLCQCLVHTAGAVAHEIHRDIGNPKTDSSLKLQMNTIRLFL